jgi:hypothetical protein
MMAVFKLCCERNAARIAIARLLDQDGVIAIPKAGRPESQRAKMLRRDGSSLPRSGKSEMLMQVERISKKIILAAGLRRS